MDWLIPRHFITHAHCILKVDNLSACYTSLLMILRTVAVVLVLAAVVPSCYIFASFFATRSNYYYCNTITYFRACYFLPRAVGYGRERAFQVGIITKNWHNLSLITWSMRFVVQSGLGGTALCFVVKRCVSCVWWSQTLVLRASAIDLTIHTREVRQGRRRLCCKCNGAPTKVRLGSVSRHQILRGGVTIDRGRATVTGLALHTREQLSGGTLGLPG